MKSEAIRPLTKSSNTPDRCARNRWRARRPAAGTTGGDSRVKSPVYFEKEVAMELKKQFGRGLLLALLSVVLFSVTQQANAQTVCNNQTGTSGGFFYTFWKDTGSACMTL